MLAIILSLMLGCGEKITYTCTEAEILQECDRNSENCTDVEDCAAEGLMCHAEMGHCMMMEDDTSEDTGMNME